METGIEVAQTRVLPATDKTAVLQLATLLKQGKIVAFATDTVYGIGADPFNSDAIAQLFQTKQRSLEKAIPILLADPTDLAKVACNIPDMARSYMARFWPGPLTIVIQKQPHLPARLSQNDSIGVRIPACDSARRLIRAAGGALATTSANLSGQPPARSAQEVVQALGGMITAVLDDGPSAESVASTVIDCTTATPKILRAGPIPAAALHMDSL